MAKVWYAGVLLMALASATTASKHKLCPDEPVTPAPGKHMPLIAGHRGAPGYRPDHTLEGYTLAIEFGVDYIEPDLVSTKDGVLVARHEPNIISTTDVKDRPEFASRKRKAVVDGVEEEGFFVSDFTLAEIKTLRAIQPMSDRDQSYNGKFQIPTFDEVIALAQAKSKEVGRPIGIYPETKHSIYHRNLGLPLEEKLLASLDKAGWNHAGAPVIIQSFEQTNLKDLRKKTKVTLAQLVDGGDVDPKTGDIVQLTQPYDWTVSGRNGTSGDLMTPAGLAEVATYADIVAPWKRYLVRATAAKLGPDGTPQDVNGDGKVTDADFNVVGNPEVFKNAHAAGLKVHTWTMRSEAYRLAIEYKGNPENEYIQLFELGLDGVFSDQGDAAVAARKKFLAKH